MAELLAQVQLLQNLASDHHWFCNNVEPTAHEVQIPSAENPRQVIKSCYRLFAYETEEVESLKQFLVGGIDGQLARCDLCIIEYYKSKKEFLDELREEYNDDDVEVLASMFHHYDMNRIRRGLSQALETLRGLSSEKRESSAVSGQALYAMIEALSCERFLFDKNNVHQFLLEPLTLVQTNSSFYVAHFVPAISEFLFSDTDLLRRWASTSIARLGNCSSQDEFDFAFRGGLSRHLARGSAYPIDRNYVDHFWHGLEMIISKLDNKLITHSLRGLEVSVYRLALDHLQIPTAGVRSIVRTLQSLLKKSPKDFWDAMGAIGPSTIAEQIFRSPHFDHVLRDTQDRDLVDTQSSLHDMLDWPIPLIASLQVGQRPPLCRTITSQLMLTVQKVSVVGPKDSCYKVGLSCLEYTLKTCLDSLSTPDITSHAVVMDALTVTEEHFTDIMDIVSSSHRDNSQHGTSRSCANVIQLALMLESKALRVASIVLQSPSKGTAIRAPRMWQAAGNHLRRGNVLLASSMIHAMISPLELEYVGPECTNADAHHFNSVLDDLLSILGRVLDNISIFSPSDLDTLLKSKGVCQSLAAIVPCAERSVHNSAVEVIKAITNEPFRKEALRQLLNLSMCATLDGVSSTAQQITSSRSFKACPGLLRTCADMLDGLCDQQGGLLRQTNLTMQSEGESVKNFWDSTWKALDMMYESSESWSTKKVASSDIMKEFVRDVMQLSEALFDQFPVFSNAIAAISPPGTEKTQVSEDSSNHGGIAKDLLLSPSAAMDGVTKFLRLKDEYLLRTSVLLVRKLLNALTNEGLALPSTSSDYLAQIAIYTDNKESSQRIGLKTLLTPTEIAGITLDLEQNIGRPVVQDARTLASLGKGGVDRASRSISLVSEKNKAGASRTTQVVLQQRGKKQGTIDFGTWSSQSNLIKDPGKSQNGEASSIRSSLSKDDTVSKSRPSVSILDRKLVPKHPQNTKSAGQQEAFLSERKKQKTEAQARRVEEAAKLKKNIPNLIAGQTSGEGSALSKLGVSGRDHTQKGESMMVSSDSESDSDDEFDKELFGTIPKNKTSNVLAEFNATRAKQMRAQAPVKKTKVVRSVKDMRARVAPQMTGLWCRLLAWEFFNDGDFPPDSTKADFSLVADSYRSAYDYRKAFEALLLLEAWSGLQKSREEGGFRTFEIKVSNRITIDSMLEVSISMDFSQCKSIGIFEADIILLSKSRNAAEDSNEPHCLGRIHRIRHKKGVSEITVRVAHGPHIQSLLAPGTSIFAARIDSIVTLEREYGALAGLEWYDLCQEIIQAQISPVLRYTSDTLDKISGVYKLNQAQAKAVKSAVDNDAFTLIQGPPGSGKTKTIVAIVGALLTESLKNTGAVTFSGPSDSSRGQNGAAAAPKKLLVCAPSNAAVDELVMRFMDGVKTTNGAFHKPKIVRLGRSDRVNAQVLEVTLDELVEKVMNPSGKKGEKESTDLEKAINSHKAVDKELKEMYLHFDEAAASGSKTSPEMSQKFEKLKRDKQTWSTQIERLRDNDNSAHRDADIKKRRAEQQVLNEANIICATLSGSARESFQHLTIDFETVIIDEAAQCIELSALIPLKYGCSKCIMVGDPKQLPPTVLSRDAARYQYEQSLFVRMQRNQPDDVHLLDTQYRMHPEISYFPSAAFYDGKLLDGPKMTELRTQPWHQDQLLSPYRFYDVAGKHETAPKGHSLINKLEIEVAIGLYRRLKATLTQYDFTRKIGIITPYKSQLRLLTDRFTTLFGQDILKTIEFNTTDAFQGRESEIIIFSCVRASDRGIGFLSDIRRMNVGITRAKSSLWVLGSSASLKQGEFWRALIEDAQGRDCYTSGNVAAILKDTPKTRIHMQTQTKASSRSTPSDAAKFSHDMVSKHDRHLLDDKSLSNGFLNPELEQQTKSHGGNKLGAKRPVETQLKSEFTTSDLSRDILPRTDPTNSLPVPLYEGNSSALSRAERVNGTDSGYSLQDAIPYELKRKRSTSPQGKPKPKPAIRPPAARKIKNADNVFIKPRRKKQ